MRIVLILLLAAAWPAASARAQAAPPAAAPAQAKPGAAEPADTDTYSYDPGGRRDPFLNLLGTGADSRPLKHGGDGPSGMSVSEISVRGVMQSRGALIAMVQGPDNRTYVVHQGDKLLDGTVKSVTPQGLVIVQEVNDPLSLIKTREVRKMLRSLEDAKE